VSAQLSAGPLAIITVEPLVPACSEYTRLMCWGADDNLYSGCDTDFHLYASLLHARKIGL
jgi:hypothetical protein